MDCLVIDRRSMNAKALDLYHKGNSGSYRVDQEIEHGQIIAETRNYMEGMMLYNLGLSKYLFQNTLKFIIKMTKRVLALLSIVNWREYGFKRPEEPLRYSDFQVP